MFTSIPVELHSLALDPLMLLLTFIGCNALPEVWKMAENNLGNSKNRDSLQRLQKTQEKDIKWTGSKWLCHSETILYLRMPTGWNGKILGKTITTPGEKSSKL